MKYPQKTYQPSEIQIGILRVKGIIKWRKDQNFTKILRKRYKIKL